MPEIRAAASDRSPRPPIRETNMGKINDLTHVRTALTCEGPAYRFRAEFRPSSTPVFRRQRRGAEQAMPPIEETREETIKRLTAQADSLRARAIPEPPQYGGAAVGYGYRIMAEMLGGVFVGLGLGWGFDLVVGSMPWGIIAGTLLGFGVSIWLAVHSAKKLSARALKEYGPPRDLPDDADEDEQDR
jgi:ATP synthase protein I